jgi:hypothetical protein
LTIRGGWGGTLVNDERRYRPLTSSKGKETEGGIENRIKGHELLCGRFPTVMSCGGHHDRK